MRVRSVAVAALFAFAPAAARAQGPITTLDRYTVAGCLDGPLTATPGGGAVPGQVVCFNGDAALEAVSTGDPELQGFLRILGTLTATFNPAFAGAGVTIIDGSSLFFDYSGPRCGAACSNEGTFTVAAPVPVGATTPTAFRAFLAPPIANVDPGSIRNVRTGTLFGTYVLPGPPSGANRFVAQGQLTFTPIPEPSTLALAGAGLLVLGAAARRRRA
jgi:hypothetical protein